MKPAQAKMARVALRWTTDDLAAAAGIGRMTVARFERGDNVTDAVLVAMRSAFEKAGANFIDDGARIGVTIPA
jgi:transcriptional regulator with XRE-family HTH domain